MCSLVPLQQEVLSFARVTFIWEIIVSKIQSPKLGNLKENYCLIRSEDHKMLGSLPKVGASDSFSVHGF